MADVLYTAEAVATGDGRNGEVHSSDGVIDEKLAVPTELGGPGGLRTNPEQLFAAAYSGCFHGAVLLAARQAGVELAGDTTVTTRVGIGPRDGGGYQLSVDIVAHLPGLESGKAAELVARAHQLCPYSNATRGNIEVVIDVTT